MQLSAVIEDAAAGTLPGWSVAGSARQQHMHRVAALMTDWARALQLPPVDCARWGATGLLHDALRDASPADLLPLVPAALRDLPPSLLHAPAAAAKLREHGVVDEPLLHAIAFHPIGHAELDSMGRALFIADHIEPGRSYDPDGLAALRARMPGDADDVLREVLMRRIRYQVGQGGPLRPETISFWNALVGDHAAAPPA